MAAPGFPGLTVCIIAALVQGCALRPDHFWRVPLTTSEDDEVMLLERLSPQPTFARCGWAWYTGYKGTLGFPFEAFLHLALVRGSETVYITRTTGLAGHVRLHNESDVAEFVNLLSNEETWYLFDDARYREVPDSSVPQARQHIPSSEAHLVRPRVTRLSDTVFAVERLALDCDGNLYRLREKVTCDGAYRLGKSRKLAEGFPGLYYE